MGRHKEGEIFNKIKDRFIQAYDIVVIYKQYRFSLANAEAQQLTPTQKQILDRVICLRADYLAVDRAGNYHIVEVKRNLDLKALGQLLGYRIMLARKQEVEESKVRLHAVFEQAYETIKDIYRRYNILLWEVG